ncbi:MAG: ABC transporter substrate-binding protein [Ruminococcus sp.]|jgi:branched-chain amino acid transport system substrate-binding protein
MKNFKKFVSLALVAVMAASCLTACGGKETQSSESGGDTFKIGGIGPITGSTAVYGMAVKNGAELAVKEINEAGGINGKQVEFQFEDDENDAEKSVNAYNTLKDWGAQMILGSVTSTPCIAVAEETHNDNMFQLTPSGTAVECVQYDNAFRVCFSDPSQGVESAQYIGENKLATKIAVIYDSSDTYSSGIYEAFAAEAKNQGLEIVAAEAFTADNKTDFSVQLQKAKDAGAELLFMPFYYQEASLVLQQAKSMNFSPIFFGVDGMDGILNVENFDASLADGVMFLAPFCPTSESEAISTFVSTYEKEYGETPNQFAADAYDGIYILKQALEQMNATTDMSASDICDGLKTAMTEITYSGVTSPEIKWSADGEPEKAPMVLQIQDGAYVEMQ